MTAIGIDRVEKRFGSLRAAAGISLEIRDGELFTLLGPSGCGKTTLLRIVAGFADLDSGAIRFGDRRVDTLPPHRRNTGMVFQNYAIFPNLTVAGNVAYGLKARRLPTADIAERVARALRLVHLDTHDQRWPHQLSGGQLQRVAIARALVIEPEVLLLDEPLSNLDAKLRVEMRGEIRRLQQQLGITALYVTHDQEEALAISDRIAVMRAGAVEQIGTPAEIYTHPASPFVAEFMGTTNLLSGAVADSSGGRVKIAIGGIEISATGAQPVGASVLLSLRPEALRLLGPGTAAPPGWAVLEAIVRQVEFLGALTRVDLAASEIPLRLALLDQPPEAATPGRAVTLAYDPARVAVFARS
jgi:ABC-type Fe3+/spermidine/putrescine transport system ATPase subunit